MRFTAIVIKYKVPLIDAERRYCNDDDTFVALDAHSGGYPYRTHVLRAQQWKTEADAIRYIGVDVDKFEVVELTFDITERIL